MKTPPKDYVTLARKRELEYYQMCRDYDAVDLFCSLPDNLQIQVLQAYREEVEKPGTAWMARRRDV